MGALVFTKTSSTGKILNVFPPPPNRILQLALEKTKYYIPTFSLQDRIIHQILSEPSKYELTRLPSHMRQLLETQQTLSGAVIQRLRVFHCLLISDSDLARMHYLGEITDGTSFEERRLATNVCKTLAAKMDTRVVLAAFIEETRSMRGDSWQDIEAGIINLAAFGSVPKELYAEFIAPCVPLLLDHITSHVVSLGTGKGLEEKRHGRVPTFNFVSFIVPIRMRSARLH